jgi:hypothetical protein
VLQSPGSDQVDCERGQITRIASAALVGQEFGERRATSKTARTLSQSVIDARPGFSWNIGDGPRFLGWPSAGPLEMGSRPGENVHHAQFGKVQMIPNAALLRQKTGQGRAAR